MPRKRLVVSVVGMHYRLTPSTLKLLSRDLPLLCELQREPDNPHDSNAVKIVVIEGKKQGMHLGYIARATATVVAEAMDDDDWPYTEAWLTSVDIPEGSGELLLKTDG